MSHLHSPHQQLLSSGYTGASAALAEAMDVVYQQADKSEPVLSSYMSGYTAPYGSAYSGGVYSPKQDKLWFIPHQNSVSPVWHYLDCRTQKVVAYTHGTSGLHNTYAAYANGSWDPDTDRIYMHPVAQTTTLHYIDCASGGVVAYKGFSGLPVRYANAGGAYDPINRRIWLPPAVGSTGTHWPYIDTKTATTGWYPHGTTGLAGNASDNYVGAVYSPASRKVFFTPLWQVRKELYHYIDCDTLKVCAYSSGLSGALTGSTGSSFNGGVYDSYHDRVYLSPFNAKGSYLYIDCKTNKVVPYAGASGVVNCDYAHGGCYSPLTRRIYLSYRNAPAYGATGMWSYIDTDNNSLVSYKGASSVVACIATAGTFVPSLNRVYFTPYGGATVSPWYYVQESAPRTPAMLPYAMATTPARGPSLVCIDEAEVSMLCVDGSDGKGGVFQLHARFSDGLYHNEWCAWSSSDPSVATVSPSGLVTAVSTGYDLPLGAVVTLHAVYNGEEMRSSVTVYHSVPDPTTRFLLPGGCGLGLTGTSTEVSGRFQTEQAFDAKDLKYHRVVSRFNEVSDSVYALSTSFGTPGSTHLVESSSRITVKRVFDTGSQSYTDYSVGPARAAGTCVLFDAVAASDGEYLGGTLYTPVTKGTGTLSYGQGAWMLFQKNLIKSVMWNAGSTGSYASITDSSSRMELMACPQNYVRTSDLTGHINKTRILNMGTIGSSYDMTATFVPGAWFGSYKGDKLCIDEAEVSMLCVDGSDGKGGVFQLHLGTGGGISYNHAASWSSSDPSVATVSSSGLVTAVSNGGAPLGKDVTITASYAGTSYSCLFTVYQTMPSAEVEGEGLWLCKGGCRTSVDIVFRCYNSGDAFVSILTDSMMVLSSTAEHNPPFRPHHYDDAFKYFAFKEGKFLYRSILNKTSYNEYLSTTVLTTGTLTRFRAYLGSEGGYVNDNLQPFAAATYNGASTINPNNSAFIWTSGHVKHTIASADTKNKSRSDMTNLRACDIGFVAQNYIRYTNRTVDGVARVSHTTIPNTGTLGGAYDLTADNVPAVWFGV